MSSIDALFERENSPTQMDGRTDPQTDGQTDRQGGRRDTDRPTGRQAGTQGGREMLGHEAIFREGGLCLAKTHLPACLPAYTCVCYHHV
mmetsp:Transcript_27962/g.80486  ORF Transcript_27962/g.80486 Transcript_27962/m.80486 type:complete len:89 (+) Transcript_27962:256-522(+)